MDAPMGRLAYLPAGVSGPDPDAFLSDVLTGWRRAQLAQNFATDTARRRVTSVLRMTDFVGSYPWQWTPADADDFFGHLRGVLNRAHTTVRAYQTDVKLFLDYATDPTYDWNEHCGRLFGTVFCQIITEFNKARHVQANDARPLKRPFTPPSCNSSSTSPTWNPNGSSTPDAKVRWRHGGTRWPSRRSTGGAYAATKSGTCNWSTSPETPGPRSSVNGVW